MVDFSAMRETMGYFAPARFDADVFDCEVVGAIPPDLDGAFYRMHADWLYPPKFADEASLSADGYISRLRIRAGKADYRGRFVRTDRFNNQCAARRQLYGYYRNPYTDDPEVQDLANPGRRTSANTTPVILAGRLYATKEDGLPHEIDPNTLDTIGPDDFNGQWACQTFTAHPKYDPATGETIAFGYEASGLAATDVFLCTFTSDGQIKSSMRFDVPHVTMLHDIAITKDHVIIPGSSGVTSLERLERGEIHWGWDPATPGYYGIVPRDGQAEDIRWFKGPERSIVHTANAWSDGALIVADMPMADGNTWPFFPDIHGTPFRMHDTTLRRVTFDLASQSDQAREEVLFADSITSFTRIDERYLGRRNRYIFVQYADRARPFLGKLPDDPRSQPVNSYARYDLQERNRRSFFAGDVSVLQEPTFIPRRADAPEGEGYLIGTAHNLETMRCEILILDAVEMAELCRIVLPFRNPSQVHGIWATPKDLPLQ